jgi:hypothetical protein
MNFTTSTSQFQFHNFFQPIRIKILFFDWMEFKKKLSFSPNFKFKICQNSIDFRKIFLKLEFGEKLGEKL